MESHGSVAKAENRAEAQRDSRPADRQTAGGDSAGSSDRRRASEKSSGKIAEEYRSGLTGFGVGDQRHGFDSFGMEWSRRTAVAAVRAAIRGLLLATAMSPTRRTDRGQIRTREPGARSQPADGDRRVPTEHADSRTDSPSESKAEACRKGGLIRGPLSYRHFGIGCHALPPEVVREQCRRIASLGGQGGRRGFRGGQGQWSHTGPATPGRGRGDRVRRSGWRRTRSTGAGSRKFGTDRRKT